MFAYAIMLSIVVAFHDIFRMICHTDFKYGSIIFNKQMK